jgi:hypothetical protein
VAKFFYYSEKTIFLGEFKKPCFAKPFQNPFFFDFFGTKKTTSSTMRTGPILCCEGTASCCDHTRGQIACCHSQLVCLSLGQQRGPNFLAG